jgi:hypothetical protein
MSLREAEGRRKPSQKSSDYSARRRKQKRRGRGPSKFNRTAVMRAVRATLDTGLPVAGVEVDPQGKIRVIVGHPGTEASGNELDQWIAKREKDVHQA